MKIKGKYGIEEYTNRLSVPDYGNPRKNIREGLKAKIYGRQYFTEDIEMYYSMQPTADGNEVTSG